MMARYKDVRSLGRSRLVPFDPAEDAGSRHARRIGTALLHADAFRRSLEEVGLTLEIKNEGHHWQIRDERFRVFAQWWPSSAKLVRGVDFGRSIHGHDVEQVLGQIRRWRRSENND